MKIKIDKGQLGLKTKYLNEAIQFAKDYRNSPGFKERWNKIGNKGVTRRLGSKYDVNEGYGKVLWSLSNWNTSNKINYWNNSSNAAYFPSQGFYIGTNKNPVSAMSNWKDELTHEVGHYFESNILPTYIDSYTKEKSPMGTYFSDLYPIFRKSKSYNSSLDLISNDEDIKNYERNPSFTYYVQYQGGYLDGLSDSLHDGTPTESYADLFILKKKLLDLGIYDVRKANNLFTVEHLKKFKKQNKDKIRLFDNFSDKDIIWMMNNVAQNNKIQSNQQNYYAKKGGSIKTANARKWKHQEGGIIKFAQQGTKVDFGQRVGNFLNSGFGQTLINGGLNLLKTSSQNKQLNTQADAIKAQNEADWQQTIQQVIKQNQQEIQQQYQQWVNNYQKGLTLDKPSDIVVQHFGNQQLNQQLAEGEQLLKNNNRILDAQINSRKAQNFGNAFSSIIEQGLGLVGNYLSNKKGNSNQ